MNYLVILNAYAGELEKILSGVKCTVIKESSPKRSTGLPLKPGDSLYFIRDVNESDVRVKASVKSMQVVTSGLDEDLSHTLKEMQPSLQLTGDQYNHWSATGKALLVEFESAQKIGAIQIAPDKLMDQSDWISFQDMGEIM